jgi:hypothetical protein
MIVVKRALRGRLRCRVVLGVLLTLVAFVHLTQVGTLPAADAAADAGLGLAYGILALMVFLGEGWACSASVVFPLIALALGDARSFAHHSNPMDAIDPFIDVLVIPVAAYVLRSRARADSNIN